MSSLRFPKKRGNSLPPTPPPVVGASSSTNMAARAAQMARGKPSSSKRTPEQWRPPHPPLPPDEHKWMGWGKKGPDAEALEAERARDERLKAALKGLKTRPASGGADRPRRTSTGKRATPTKRSSSAPRKRIVPRYPTLEAAEQRVAPTDSTGDSELYRKLLDETAQAAESVLDELASEGGEFEKQLITDMGVQTGSDIESIRRLNQKPREAYANDVGSSSVLYAPRESQVPDQEEQSDPNLVTVMAMRLNKLERLVRRLNTELAEKDAELNALLHDKKGTKGKNGTKNSLKRQNCRLKKELASIHSFLSDYGLTWVGEPGSSDDDDVKPVIVDEQKEVQWGGNVSPRSPYRKSEQPKPQGGISYDTRQLLSRIKELNILAGDGTTAFKRGSDGRTHKLQPPETIPLVLYKDGFLLRSGPFRPHTEESAALFINDILDGFFPHQLKDDYPDGVVFDVTDRTLDEYNQQDDTMSFPGSGQVLGGRPPIRVNIHQLGEAPNNRLTSEELLSRLPKSVVRSGRVIKVRDDVKDMLSSEQRVIEMNTSDVDGDTATLRIKSHDMTSVYVVKLPKTATIKDLRQMLDEQIDEELPPYQLRTAFPPVLYDEVEQTLADAGLVPSATLFMKCV